MRLLLISSLCVLSLAACGDKSEVGDKDDATTTTTADDTGGDTGDHYDPDLDHDGYPDSTDCDDQNYAVHPDADELCDGLDNDCDEEVDEGWDSDADGHYSQVDCDYGDDCDDGDPTVYPGADEVPYDGVDQDCDGEDLLDADGDGFDATDAGGNDCDDTDDTIYPGAFETAKDGIDQDCDGVDLLDGDGDGYDDEEYGGEDCDDTDSTVRPGALDWMNDGVDTDCDGRDGARMDVGEALISIEGDAGASDYLGNSLAVCDLDGDGVDDLLISAPMSGANYQGRIGVFLGAGSADWGTAMALDDADILLSSVSHFLGFGLACDDVDGDGFDDIVAGRGEIVYSSGRMDTDFGLVIWYGDGIGWDPEITDHDADAELSIDLGAEDEPSVASREFSTGDLDGDGAAELLINMTTGETGSGAPMNGDSSLWIIPGAAYSGLLAMDDLVAARVVSDTTDAITDFGVIDDLDGDGTPDLFVGQGNDWVYDADTDETTFPGSVGWVSGVPSADGTLADVCYASVVGTGTDGLGYEVEFGDMDADGVLDALIGVVAEDNGGADDAGAVYFVSDIGGALSGTGLALTDLSEDDTQGQWREGYLGIVMGFVGDVNGDGLSEVLVDEPGGGASGYGRVHLFSGARMSGNDADPGDWDLLEWEPDADGHLLGSTMAAADFDGDGVPDLVLGDRGWGYPLDGSYTGRVVVYMTGAR